MKMNHAMRCATAVSFALFVSTAYAADTTDTRPITGKEKATAIGAGTGAVAGAVVGGPVGAVVGGVAGGIVGHQGTDANGRVSTSPAYAGSDGTVKNAQAALNSKGYNAGTADGRMGPTTSSAISKFQADNNLPPTGTLDSATTSALGIK